MFSFLEIPWVPIIALTVSLPLVVWQFKSYLKDKNRNKTPNIPQLNQKKTNKSDVKIKNATLLTKLKSKNKVNKKTPVLFTTTVTVFVLLNVVIVFFYLNNKKISYIPRAQNITNPTSISNTDRVLTPLLSPTITPTGAYTSPTQAPIPSSTALPTTTPTRPATPISTATPINTVVPTHTTVPTKNPTLIAQAYNVPTYSPTHSPTSTPKPSPSPTITKQITPETKIPVVGESKFSGILIGLSFLLLTIGFIL